MEGCGSVTEVNRRRLIAALVHIDQLADLVCDILDDEHNMPIIVDSFILYEQKTNITHLRNVLTGLVKASQSLRFIMGTD